MRIANVAAVVALIVTPIIASAHADHDEDAIEARRAYFDLVAANIGPLAAMAKGEVEYDAERAMLHAQNFAAIKAYNPMPHFPAGTSNEDLPGKTRSLPSIWENPTGFGEKVAAFHTAIDGLQEVAGAGRAELGGAVQKLGATCKACHDDYRAKDF